MPSRAHTLALVLTTAVAAISTTILIAGPLTPPPGAPAPTYKTLQEVEPRIAINSINTPGDADSLFKITQPGSYYLTGNITGATGRHGIEIAASGVTIDLNGFDLVGVPAMGSFDGVTVTLGNLTNITVRNGSIRGWGDKGVDLDAGGVDNARVEGVVASSNGGGGIGVSLAGIVSNCTAALNAGVGITASLSSTISNCNAYDNGSTGISTGNASTVTHCTAYSNGSNGISAGFGCTISNCTAYLNTSNGISTSAGCVISHCAVYLNSANGISANSASTVVDCNARSNTLDGILFSSSCVIRGNTCTSNGSGAGDGAGIHATGSDNRIEGNHCQANDRGIDVDSPGNIIIKNTCAGNTGVSWSIAANNYYGSIIDRTNITADAVNGPSAPSSLFTTDPNVNVTY